MSNGAGAKGEAAPRAPRSRRSIASANSLHELGRQFQLKYLSAQADELLESLDDLMLTTERVAPIRRQPYPLARDVAGTPRGEESRWERAIWDEWHAIRQGLALIPGVCTRVISYQVMLRDTNRDRSWGEVDLVGESPQHLPVVIELKGPSSIETPLRGIVEAVAYAIALRKAWSPCLRDQWCGALDLAPDHLVRRETPPVWRAVFAAPTGYWTRVLGRSGPKWRVRRDVWLRILRLCDAFAQRGLPVSLVRLDAGDPVRPRGITGHELRHEEILSEKG